MTKKEKLFYKRIKITIKEIKEFDADSLMLPFILMTMRNLLEDILNEMNISEKQ